MFRHATLRNYVLRSISRASCVRDLRRILCVMVAVAAIKTPTADGSQAWSPQTVPGDICETNTKFNTSLSAPCAESHDEDKYFSGSSTPVDRFFEYTVD